MTSIWLGVGCNPVNRKVFISCYSTLSRAKALANVRYNTPPEYEITVFNMAQSIECLAPKVISFFLGCGVSEESIPPIFRHMREVIDEVQIRENVDLLLPGVPIDDLIVTKKWDEFEERYYIIEIRDTDDRILWPNRRGY